MAVTLLGLKQRFGIIGNNALLDRALDTAMRIADTDLSVLISGESGTGKEVFSKIIHSLSVRKHNNFIAINCGAIPAGTINSELFGHEKGAFTGATSDRKGYFETVDGGTIFLDEIGEMPLDTQAFLLRVLESGEYIRVGSSVVQTTNVRVVAATNVNLLEQVQKGKFREDLYYRLNTVPIALPPLRDRGNDIYLLFRKFTVDFAENYNVPPIKLDDQARQLILTYSWPGNIRELKNVAQQLSVLSEKRELDLVDLVELQPQLTSRNLPARFTADKGKLEEREILYKLLFEMKNDLNDLKSLVFELIQNNDLDVPSAADMQSLMPTRFLLPESASAPTSRTAERRAHEYVPDESSTAFDDFNDEAVRPIILHDNEAASRFNRAEVVEENLSLAENEKDLIRKALKKHNNRRKEASEDLGISERTLYRKIKEYEL